jgi:hypothetical protein
MGDLTPEEPFLFNLLGDDAEPSAPNTTPSKEALLLLNLQCNFAGALPGLLHTPEALVSECKLLEADLLVPLGFGGLGGRVLWL